MADSYLGTVALRERTRREILHGRALAQPLPEVVTRVLGLLRESDTNPEDLEAVLLRDEFLVGKLLGVINSPFFALHREITSVRHAIMVVGFRGLRSLVLASGVAVSMKRDLHCYGHGRCGLVHHSMEVAAGARALGKVLGDVGVHREELFVAGLMHDIGKLALAPHLHERGFGPVAAEESNLGREWRYLGVDHAEVGELLCRQWHVGRPVPELVGHHHDLHAPEPLRVGAAVLRVADALAHERTTGYERGQAPVPVYLDEDLESLGLTRDGLQGIREVVETAVDDAMAGLGQL